MSDLSRKGRFSLLIGFSSLGALILYNYLAMDGRTELNDQDRWFFWSMIVIIFLSVFYTIADRAKKKGEVLSWKRFGIILFILVLFGLWRIIV
jgi:phosphoglycerol transferase MdoB-like AlkP superfamily enzyme